MYPLFSRPLPVLKNSVLNLRSVSESDTAALFEMMSDEENGHFMSPTLHKTIEDSIANISYIERQYRQGTGIFFAVTAPDDDTMIGLVGANKIDESENSARISYLINKNFWGRGYGPLATNMLVDFIFHQTPIAHLEATIKPENKNSARCIEKAGFRLERIIDDYISSAKEDTSKVRLLYVREKGSRQ